MSQNPIKITDTTFRDAHQSLMATRLRTSDMEPLAPGMDAIGFHSMEVWGGATFDSATRFLGEDPWDRLRSFKKLMPNTPLMMLLRGQSLVGYRNYADDVVRAFVRQSAEVGIDIFRVFDALNDERNLQTAMDAVRESGKHLQLTICYSVTEEGRLGGPIYNLEYYVQKALRFQELGADSICIKDMAGLMAPYDAYTLVSALKQKLDVPLQLHTHYTSGMASMSALKAIEAGLDVVDTCLAPLALRTAQPAVEPLSVALSGSDRDPGLDLSQLLEMGDRLEAVLPAYRQHMESPRAAVIDAKVLSHQIPGGMASNLISQLREADALDRLDEVLADIPNTRMELGYPPLVTPMSQMVGSQAVSNVLFGRYKMVSGQVKDYVYGLYGSPPAQIDPSVAGLALEDYKRGSEPISVRPADLIEPEMEQAQEAVSDITSDIEDVLTYALYPTTGLRFLRIKHGLEELPDEMKPTPPAAEADTASPRVVRRVSDGTPKSARARRFNVYVGDELFEVEVDPVDGAGSRVATAAPGRDGGSPASDQKVGATLNAPMPGIVLRYLVEAGQTVAAGDPMVVLEAMKMENTLPSPIDGSVGQLPLEPGATVKKDQVLATIIS